MTGRLRPTALGLLLVLVAASPARPEDAIAAALKSLDSPKAEERLAALTRLALLGKDPRTEKAVVARLADPDWEVQIRAAETLAKVGGEASVDALLKQALEGEIQWVRDAAVATLAELKPPEAAERLLKRVRSEEETSGRVRALHAVGALAGPDLLPKLREWTRYRDPRVAAEAVRAVGRVAARDPGAREAAVKLLEPALGSRDERREFFAYAAAVEALASIDDPVCRALVADEVLKQPDSDPYVLDRIVRGARALEPQGVAEAVRAAMPAAKKPPALARLARWAGEARLTALRPDLERLLEHRDESVRSEATRALGWVPDASSGPALLGALDDPSPIVRVEAVTALARTLEPDAFRALGERLAKDAATEVRVQFVVELNDAGAPEGIAALEPFLADGDWRVASASAAAIGTLGVAKDLPLLEPLVRHKSWKIRAAALEGLARLRAAPAVPLLAQGLQDKDPIVQGVCHANLQILTRQKLGTKPDRWLRWWEDHGKDLVLVKRSRRTEEEKAKEREAEEKVTYAHERERLYAERKRGIEVLQKARILVVTGAWDHVEKVLGHLQIPYTLLRAQELKESGLNPNQVVLVNCEGNVDKDGQDRLRWFVNVGGYLMTTDWALTHTVEPCFPGYLRQYSGSSTGNDVVVVEDARPGHPWTKGIFDGVPALEWWLEVQAFPITVGYPERCEVLVDSAAMRQRYGSSTMATAFRWGLGKVQHSISHFYLQEEGLVQATDARSRMVFAADHLGIPLAQIRKLAEAGRWAGQPNEETMKEIAPEYSMFRLIVNVVKEKSDWVENL